MNGSDVSYGTVTIGGTAAVVKAGNSRRKAIVVQNVHASQDLYLGDDSSVTTSNGLKVAAGESILVPTTGPIYGIASGAGTDVRYFEAT